MLLLIRPRIHAAASVFHAAMSIMPVIVMLLLRKHLVLPMTRASNTTPPDVAFSTPPLLKPPFAPFLAPQYGLLCIQLRALVTLLTLGLRTLLC